MQSTIVGAFHPLVERDLRLLELLAEEVGAQNGQQHQRAEQGPEEGERHRVRHRPEQASRWAGQHVDGEVAGDDDRNRVEDRPLDVAGRAADDFDDVELLAVACSQFAEDVLDHDDRAVDDHAEIDRADRQQVGRDVRPVQADEREEQGERNGDGDDQRRADAEEQQPEDHEDEDHAA